MNRLRVYYKYFYDYIKHREFGFVISAINYIVFKKPCRKTSLLRSQTGYFLSRKGTIDFQFANYAYEWSVKSFILNNYKNYDIFFDVGSNVGTYAVLMAKAGMKVFAFEPIVENYRAIIINIHLNSLENKVKAFNFGLGDKENNIDFIYDPVNTGASHYSHPGENKGIHETVKIKTLDSVYREFGLKKTDRILMKVDVEGMEVEAFDGAKEFLELFSDLLIVFESKHTGLDNIRKVLDNIADFEYMTIDHYNTATKKMNK